MKDEFANRFGMFQTALGILNSAEHKSTWENQSPTIVTSMVQAAQQGTDELAQFLSDHSTDITGAAADKKREEQELEDAVFAMGVALGCWFEDQNDQSSAAQANRPISSWRRMRDAELIAQSKTVRDLAQSLVDGPQSMEAAAYGIDSASVQALSSELADYETLVTAPQQNIAERKALTAQFRPRFNEVEAKFEKIDRMIILFNKTPAGRALIAAYQAARIIRDLGRGPFPTPDTPPGPQPT